MSEQKMKHECRMNSLVNRSNSVGYWHPVSFIPTPNEREMNGLNTERTFIRIRPFCFESCSRRTSRCRRIFIYFYFFLCVIILFSCGKMVFKWNDQNTLLFLENFKNYQCLWNHKIDEYKDRTMRANSIKSLISDLNLEITEEDIKHKIKTIRTRYTTELTKIKQSTKSGCSSDDVYVPTLYWFKHAEFLSSVCVPRQSTSSLVSRIFYQSILIHIHNINPYPSNSVCLFDKRPLREQKLGRYLLNTYTQTKTTYMNCIGLFSIITSYSSYHVPLPWYSA